MFILDQSHISGHYVCV